MDASTADKRQTELLAQFGPWTDPTSNEQPPMVLVGAGLSYQLAPAAGELAAEIASRREAIERTYGVRTDAAIGSANELYAWAEQCLVQKQGAGTPAAEAKKLLAEAMGLTSDARFLAQANIPIRGTTARHRVLCRLAREGRVSALWSFNWDCWLEMSLECVGFRRGERLGSIAAPPVWKLRYHVWVDSMPGTSTMDSVPVFKAHGCLRALAEGQGDFVISRGEMTTELALQPPARISRMKTQIEGRWAVALGWSASEAYVRDLIAEQGQNGVLGGRVTIVDLDPSQDDHQHVCTSYGCETGSAGLRVNGESPGDTDDLFLWIQTRRGLAAMREAVPSGGEIVAEILELEGRIPVFDATNFRRFWCVSFLDSWIPVWLKTCFMTGAEDHRTHPAWQAEILPPDQRDAHIPWGGFGLSTRRDFQAAARLASGLAASPNVDNWDFEVFPGGLWNISDQTLVLPVPIWVDVAEVATVRLKPLVESNHWFEKSRIHDLHLMPLLPEKGMLDDAEVAARLARWREVIASLFGQAHLAMPDNIKTFNLEQLASKEGTV